MELRRCIHLLPKINDNLYIQVASLDENEAKEEYKSRVADIQEKYISIEIPLNVQSGKLKRLTVGDQLSAYYVNAEGVKHYFNTDVLGMKNDVVRLYVIKKPDLESITKVQRRNHLRVPAELEISVNLKDKIHFICHTVDMGGGGVSFLSSTEYPIKSSDALLCYVLIHYKNGSIEHCKFIGEVIRVKPVEHSNNQLVMMKFKEIEDSEQQKIIRFCFERQLELRKK
jgi:c-di-GMP-binding flagellar brake protein YcgR